MRYVLLLLMMCANFKLYSVNKKIFSALKRDNLEEVFVQRWSWMSICDYAYANDFDGQDDHFKNTTPFVPETVPAGSVIFATAFSIDKFFAEIHPRINNPYILVTICHGPTYREIQYVNDPKIIAWFGCTNREAIQFPKFTIIPLGILRDEKLFAKRKKVNRTFKKLRAKPKTKLLYMNFTVHEGRFDGRGAIYNAFKDKNFCFVGGRKPFFEYLKEMSEYKFVISPEGDLHDCYRHWEAIFIGAIPIVKSSPLDDFCKDLPIVIVNDWSEVTEEFLNRKYEEMKDKQYNLRKLYMQYWVDKIAAAKRGYFESCK
jgi:hypothetical protein